jgi:hypothetical protein
VRSMLPRRPFALLGLALLAVAGAAAAEDPVSLATGAYYYGKRVAEHQAEIAEEAAEAQSDRLGPLFEVVWQVNHTKEEVLANGTAALEDAPGTTNATLNATLELTSSEREAAEVILEDEDAALADAIEGAKAQLHNVESYAMDVALYQLSRL